MKKWEYEVLSKVKWGLDLDYETKRVAHLILEREGNLVKEQLSVLERKEIALAKQLEELQEQLRKVRSGIRRLEYKDDKLFDFKINM